VYALVHGDSALFASTASGLYRSFDEGENWIHADSGLNGNQPAILAAKGKFVFGGTYDGRAFLSKDNGRSWADISDGLAATYISGIGFDPNYAYVSNYGGGVWRRPLAEVVNSVETKRPTLRAGSFSLRQNYPNPFNPVTTISFDLPKGAFATLKIFNLLGEEVSVVLAEELEAGSHRVNFDGSGMPSGVYFYRLAAGEFVAMRKFELIK
jgi:hypothetical protein